jgi:3-oxoacyl-[acyl-carrier protein] reductase
MRFHDSVVVITGGAQGIGLVTAQAFAREGATVILWDVNADKGALALQQFAEGQSVEFIQVNVTVYGEVVKAVETVIARHQKIDVLINNAGITRDASLMKMTPEQWQQVIDVNLTGVFHCTKAVAPYMAERMYGRILNASSVVGIYGNFGQTNYVATKAGVIGLAKTWAKELGRKGITVNVVAPGFIGTEMITTVPEKVITMMKDRSPLGRIGTSEDIAHAYLFLASKEAGFITGAVLSVDGGLTL